MATIKDFARMCKSNQNEGFCTNTCPIFNAKGNKYCFNYIASCIEEAEAIIGKWVSEHPIKTYADDFFEKFPKAGKFDDGTPYENCVNNLYGTDFPCDENCKSCWNREYKEEEE